MIIIKAGTDYMVSHGFKSAELNRAIRVIRAEKQIKL